MQEVIGEEGVTCRRHYEHFQDSLIKGHVAVLETTLLSTEEKNAFIKKHQAASLKWYAEHGQTASALQLVRHQLEYQEDLERVAPTIGLAHVTPWRRAPMRR